MQFLQGGSQSSTLKMHFCVWTVNFLSPKHEATEGHYIVMLFRKGPYEKYTTYFQDDRRLLRPRTEKKEEGRYRPKS